MKAFKKKPKTEREKVAERREEVLAKGRKFKYPMQYSKHKLVINTIIIAFVAVILMVAAGWFMFYKSGSTGDMVYRIAQVLPLPVAEVDGEQVRYSDYLMIYRSNLMTAEQQGGQLGQDSDDKAVRQMYKQAAMQSAVEYTYALKMAKELGIEVSEAEVDKAFDDHRKVGGAERSEEGFLKILQNNFGMNKREYRRMLYLTLMKAKVTQAVDQKANDIADKVDKLLAENDNDFGKVAEELGDAVVREGTNGLVDAMIVDGGRSNMAQSMEKGQVSKRFLSSNGDGYYYLKLIDKTENQVNHESLKIDFTEFDNRVAALYADGKVKEYIDLSSKASEEEGDNQEGEENPEK